eukprot:TRINITY_DN18684_c0_g1_i1.p1 TRINITY_DN18684_c0_g1~~TRINITY_DN18684_c0_g1_i1.p1  ORF type:complete len:280 (+),score=62.69 TRINITY_DN18684_c0_g1_i1:211-1050(+)
MGAEVYPIIRSLLLELPTLFPSPIFHLLSGEAGTVYLTRKQVAALISCSFMGFFGEDYLCPEEGTNRKWPKFNISYLHSREFAKCLLHYFQRITEKMPEGYISITRKVLIDPPQYSSSKKPLVNVTLTNLPIESFHEHQLHADFANQYIGGGVLKGGNLQEEITFITKPECLVALLICEKMESNEAIVIRGAEQFSAYTGYGGSMKWKGPFYSTTPTFKDEEGRLFIKNDIISIDANAAFGDAQYTLPYIDRDINKAYLGISQELKEPLTFVTGNWVSG